MDWDQALEKTCVSVFVLFIYVACVFFIGKDKILPPSQASGGMDMFNIYVMFYTCKYFI